MYGLSCVIEVPLDGIGARIRGKGVVLLDASKFVAAKLTNDNKYKPLRFGSLEHVPRSSEDGNDCMSWFSDVSWFAVVCYRED